MPSWSNRGARSHNAKPNGVPLEAIGATVSELHEIWQVEGKQHSDPDSYYYERCLNLGEFLSISPENSVFAIYSNICFSLITFSLKVRIRSYLLISIII